MSNGDSHPPERARTGLAPLQRPVMEVNRAQAPAPMVAKEAPRKGGGVSKLLLIPLALLLLAIGGTVGYFARSRGSGVLVIELSPNLPGKAQLTINGKELGAPERWPLTRPMDAGPALVTIRAEGYQELQQLVEVAKGKKPTTLKVELKQGSDLGQLIVVTDPETAELKLDGKVIKVEGTGGFRPVAVPVGAEQVVTVSRKGYQPVERRFTTPTPDEPLAVFIKLSPENIPVEVSSEPSGATIFAGDEQLGRTPAALRVGPNTKVLTLRKRCYQPRDLELKAPSDSGEVLRLSGELTRVPGCR
jgi:hypothetical protein